MGVYIKGMEMPKNCAVCRLEKDLFGRAVCFGYEDGRALNKDDLPPVGNEERRPLWCPLVPVPPHGRLIDADKAAEKVWELMRFPSNLANAQWFENTLREMPTIIPAEKGEGHAIN